MKKVKLGIIGCGGIANAKHMPSMSKLEDVEIVAFCDIIVERAQKAKKGFGKDSGEVFADYHELLKTDVDAVCVCTPNISHCEITVASLEAGKHVICEKPMAMSYDETKKMIEARDKSKKLLTFGYQNRYRPDSIFMKQEAQKDTFGEIYYARAKAIRRRAVPTWGVFMDKEKQGGGPLIDIGTHALDLTLFMMNNYEPAYCVGTTYQKLNKQTQTGNAFGDWDVDKFTVEDSAFGFIVMKNGATINLEASWALNTLDEGEAITSICGTKAGADMMDGTVRINGVMNGRQYQLTPNLRVGGVDFFAGTVSDKSDDVEARTFINAILGKGELYVLPEQAAVVSRILEGIYTSAASGKPYYFTEENK